MAIKQTNPQIVRRLEEMESSLVEDHGALTGLGDDDHTQYHNDARGDARYSQLGHTHTESEITDLGAYLTSVQDGDIDSEAAADGYVLTADGAGNAAWEAAAGGASAIDDLSDVDTSTVAPTDGQALVWSSTDSEWQPGDVAAGGGGSSGATSVDIPVVQSAYFDGSAGASVSVVSSTETGWSVSRTSTGQFVVTFPDAASSVDAQYLSGAVIQSDSTARSLEVRALTTTTATIKTRSNDGNTVADLDFTLIRRLPDTTVNIDGGSALTTTTETITTEKLIEKKTLSADTSATFSGLDSTAKRYVFKYNLIASAASSGIGVSVTCNSDASTDYTMQRAEVGNAAAINTESLNSANVVVIPGSTGDADRMGTGTITIEDPSDTTYAQVILNNFAFKSDDGNLRVGSRVIARETAGPDVTSVVFTPDSGNFTGYIECYEVHEVAVVTEVGGNSKTRYVREVVEELTLSADSNIHFTSIPQDGKNLYIEIDAQLSTASDAIACDLYQNGDETAANYHRAHHYVANGSVSASEGTSAARSIFVCGTSSEQDSSWAEIQIKNYTSTTQKVRKGSFAVQYADDNILGGDIYSTHDTDTAAITELKIVPGSGTFTGTARLIIEREESIASVGAKTGKVLIQELSTETFTEDFFNFTGIPGGYSRLIMEGTITSDVASTVQGTRISMNGNETETDYYSQYRFTTGTGITETENAVNLGPVIGCANSGDIWSTFKVVFEGYADTTRGRKRYHSTNEVVVSNTEIREYDVRCVHDSLTTAITSLLITTSSPSTDFLKGTIRLYGEY